MQWKNKKKNTFVAENARGSHFFCNLHPISEQMLIGEMLEWLKRRAWKARIRLKRIRGSNPLLSANDRVVGWVANIRLQPFLFSGWTNLSGTVLR